jgi:RecB family exonuclease
MEALGTGIVPASDGLAGKPRVIRSVAAPDRMAQVHVAAEWAAGLPAGERDDAVIVLADESLLLPLLDALPDLGAPVNATMGAPLAALPVQGLVDRFLRLIAGPGHRLRPAEAEALLLHPLLHRPEAGPLIAELHGFGPDGITADSFIALLRERDWPGCADAQQALAPIPGPEALQARIAACLAWAKAGRADDQLALEQLYQTAKAEQELWRSLHRAAIAPADAGEYAIIRKRILRDAQMPFFGEPLSGLQVMGLLETRALDHRRVMILGADDATLFGTDMPQSWIPFDLRRHYRLPLPNDSEDITAYHLNRLLHHAEELVLVHGSGDAVGEPARIIAQWQHAPLPGTTRIEREARHAGTLTRPTAIISVRKGPAVMARLHDMAGRGFSPSALGTWLRCPLDFYFTELLRIRGPEDSADQLGSDVLGTAVHAVLERIHRERIGLQLRPEDLAGAADALPGLLAEELRKHYPDAVLSQGHHRLRASMAEQALTTYLKAEARRCAERLTTTIAVEHPLAAVLANGTRVRGICDRIERRDGILHVLDTKTGAAKPEDLRLDGLDRSHIEPHHRYALQLLIYALCAFEAYPDAQCVRAGIIPLRTPSASDGVWLSIGGESTLPRSLAPAMSGLVERLIAELMDPALPFEHDKESPWCTACVG